MGHRIRSKNTGFTLVELLITIAILALVSAFAIPKYADMVTRNRIAGATNELVATIHMARSEAVATHARVVVCPTSNGTGCGSGDWARILVFVDRDRNGSVSSGDQIKREVNLRTPDLKMTAGTSGANIVFSPDGLSASGLATSTNNFITVCSTSYPEKSRRVRVGVSTSSTGSLATSSTRCQ
jgi:type IV fimbrial biogenesis protein FimT